MIFPIRHRRVGQPAPPGAAVLLFVLAVSSCGTTAPAAIRPAAGSGSPGPSTRVSDHLLVRPELQALVDLQVARDAGALIERLGDADAAVRARAAFALGSVQDARAVPSLVPLLDDARAAVRADAAFALGQTPDPRGAAALLGRLGVEKDSTVLLELLSAVGRAGGAAELAGLVALDLAQPRAADHAALRAEFALALARFGLRSIHDSAATEWLVAALGADQPEVRATAAYYFGRVSETAAWSPFRRRVVEALDALGPDDRAAGHLLLGLSRLEGDDHADRMSAWLSDAADWRVRVSAARALQRRSRSADARAALVRALDDPVHHVRRAAAEALVGAPLAQGEIPAVLHALERHAEEPTTAAALLDALVRLERPRLEAVVLEWILERRQPAVRRATTPILARLHSPAATAELERLAADDDARLAALAVAGLAERGAEAGEEAARARRFRLFANALRRGEPALAQAAAAALADSAFRGMGGGPLLQSAYLQMAPPSDTDAMVAVLEALAAVGDSSALPLLGEALASERPALRRAAARALTQLTGREVRPLDSRPAPSPAVDWPRLAARGARPRLIMETERGRIVLELDAEQAPLTVQTVLGLAEAGAYDDVPFHRVVPNFVIQGGDYTRGDGRGGPDSTIRSEFTRTSYGRGTLGMASAGKDTEGSQYFITHAMQPHLDGRYTAFGAVVEGLDVVDAIRQGDRVLTVEVRAGAAGGSERHR